MIHYHNQNTRFRSITDCFYCIVVDEIKIFFNLLIHHILIIKELLELSFKEKNRKVLKIITRHSTSMISNDTQSQSEHSISQYY